MTFFKQIIQNKALENDLNVRFLTTKASLAANFLPGKTVRN